ncbi:DoxX family protein [Sporomusa sp.]|uniref:DoxX family protein n=1 Tax=Sporomusa sp. TaxID=2078658 RepID=UPI002BFB527F|nr:DoxX family protein [Sporomusa sp.]HWR42011.1 DoxX family protein [Sporomusa sp.]
MILRNWDKHRELGILLLRLGIGLMFVYHGWPKISGGVETWVKLGAAMKFLGMGFAPEFWGFMSAATEFFGGILIAIGLLTRPVAMFLTFNMIVAVVLKFSTGAGLGGASQAIEVGIVFLSLIFIGPGKYSIDGRFQK